MKQSGAKLLLKGLIMAKGAGYIVILLALVI